MINSDLLHGQRQCDTDIVFPHQERPPDWVWTVWIQTLHKVCIIRNVEHEKLTYLLYEVTMIPTVPSITLPTRIDTTVPLKEMVRELPLPYQMMLGDITYSSDDGAALAKAITEGRATMYTDGTVDKGCRAHAYTL